MERKCLACGHLLNGRIDQKFCSDQCRNTYNNQLNRDENATMRNVSRQLRKNRRILKELNGNGNSMVKKHIMLSKGFCFQSITGIRKNKDGSEYYLCFDQAYQPADSEEIILFTEKEP